MRFLVVGSSGSIAGKHIKNINIIDSSIEIETCDPNGERYKDIAEIENINERYGLVLICSPTLTHLNYIHYLNDHGVKRIFCEKPLCSLPTDYQILMQAGRKPFARELKSDVMIGYAYKFYRGLRKLKELSETLLGRLNHVSFENSYAFSKLHPHYKHDEWDGILVDDTHTINLSRWMFGEPVKILSKYAEKDFAQWNWKTGSGLIVSHMTDALNQRRKKRIEVRGEEGTLIWNESAHEIFFAPKDESERVAIAFKHADHLYEEMAFVVDKVKSGEPFGINTIEDAAKDMEIYEELIK